MNCPPSKRLRGLNQDSATVMEFDDPFGDDKDFTQDDLDEIDIIASQAISSAAASGLGSKPVTKPTELAGGSVWIAGQGSPSGEQPSGFSSSARGHAGTAANRQQQLGSARDDPFRLLEAQHAALKRKLKEVEEEIVLKSGEIRVLRDCLKGAQQEKEAQRQKQVQLEAQRQREQSDREKELNKKVQSLQSELQFKEAEINEMKSKLISSDKNKMASPLSRNSPKVPSSVIQQQDGGSSSSSPSGTGFITKETFGGGVPSRATPVKTRRDGGGRGSSSKETADRLEGTHPDPFMSVSPAVLQHRGGLLLGLLLQQPLSPSSFGLSHLLSMNLTDINPPSSGLSAGLLLCSAAAGGGDEGGATGAALSLVQSLAGTGLNMLIQQRPEAAAGSRNGSSCPGAVLLLPLLDLHLARLCGVLDSLRSPSSSDPSAGSSAPAGPGRLEETGSSDFAVEDIGLAALRLLYLLVAHSDEVVEAVLSEDGQSGATDKKIHLPASGLCSQNALLQSVLRLCETGPSSSTRGEELVLNSMKVLCVLIERTPNKHSSRLECVLQVLCVSLTTDSRLRPVSECVCVLMSMCDHQMLAQQLCSQHDPCVFLKLFQLIRTRADRRASHSDWIQLDLQVVRLLTSLLTQRAENWTNVSCQCYSELVQTLVIIFHRQWLDVRGSLELTDSTGPAPPLQQSSAPWWCSDAASLLREALLLLHWLLLHHHSFSQSCRPLLHMYDQVIPAIRDTLRRIPTLSESEELALEEVCRSEGDDGDDMDTIS